VAGSGVSDTGAMVTAAGLRIAPVLHEFAMSELLPGTGVDPEEFWNGMASLVAEFGPRTRAALGVRDHLQKQLDDYHQGGLGHPDPKGYEAFLRAIGYLRDEPEPFAIQTANVDPEIATQCGPQLVVPLLNARFAVNAANARWGSLYDAVYGTDVLPDDGELARGRSYSPARGAEVIAFGRRFLDDYFPLHHASHTHVDKYEVGPDGLSAVVGDKRGGLLDAAQLVGYRGDSKSPTALLLSHHGLHVEIAIDRAHPVGSTDRAGIYDLILESAITTIMDLEDSVAAVDANDKVLGYRNWLQLMQGHLEARVEKGDASFVRRLSPDRAYIRPDGTPHTLPGRSLLLVRNVGHHMTSDAVLDSAGAEVPEGILDVVFTSLGAMHDLRDNGPLRNSRQRSVYIVKPKMHGPDEVALTVDLFAAVERMLGLPELTLKLGIMDEERRTTVNLRACVHAARQRVAFINTGFLDRTGDEIHTSRHAGPVVPKAQLRTQTYLSAYEDHNVDCGLSAKLPGRAQVGKGMWAMPDLMAAMLEQKVSHPRAGATTAWVPSPTAATLHALHYHQVDVPAVQRELVHRRPRPLGDLLTLPLADNPEQLTVMQLQEELDNNLQSILGYVVRWIDQGIGCSKVPDITGTALMEDRATLRISSQLLANWLLHGLTTPEEIDAALQRVAPIVDRQNADDPRYQALFGEDGPGIAYRTARDLVIQGATQPNGYTEPLLHRARRARKAEESGPTQ
jgi:malate synthase